MNTEYKEEKGKLKEEICSLVNKNEILEKTKNVLEKQIKDLENKLKNKNMQFSDLSPINNNTNINIDSSDFKTITSNDNFINNNCIYINSEPKKDKNIISKYKNDIMNKKKEVNPATCFNNYF